MTDMPGSRKAKTMVTIDTWIAAVGTAAHVVMAIAAIIQLLAQ